MKRIKKVAISIVKSHFIFEIIFLIAFIIIFILEINKAIDTSCELSQVVDIITILLPAIITVISISLSLSNEKILNLKRSEFRKLLGRWYYDFLTMIITVVAIFALYTICKLLDMDISVLVLEVISVFYACYYSSTEIPVLLQQESRIINIVKRYYHSHRNASYKYYLFDKQENIIIALQYLLFQKGIKYTYLALKNNIDNNILLDDLLSIQNNFLFNARF